jgi:hypothetical protein
MKRAENGECYDVVRVVLTERSIRRLSRTGRERGLPRELIADDLLNRVLEDSDLTQELLQNRRRGTFSPRRSPEEAVV